MTSICSKKAVEDVILYDPSVQTRFVNLQKWAESDAAFVKRVTNGVHKLPHPTVVDSVSCRQMYLRSYKFSRKKETVPEKTKKRLSKVKEQVVVYTKKIMNIKGTKKKDKVKKKKKTPGSAPLSTFRYFKKRLVEEEEKGKKRATGWLGGGGFCMRRLACVRKVRDVSCGILLNLFRRLQKLTWSSELKYANFIGFSCYSVTLY